MKHLFVLLVLTCLCVTPAVTRAAETIPWEALSGDEQRILQRLQERWDELPAQRQETLRRGATRWQSMTPEQRERARRNLERWREMSPEQRAKLRERLRGPEASAAAFELSAELATVDRALGLSPAHGAAGAMAA